MASSGGSRIYKREGQGRGAAQASPPLQIFFSILDLKMATLGAFWALFFAVHIGADGRSVGEGFLISRLEIAYVHTRCPLTAPNPVTACFLKLGFSYSLSSLTKRHPCTHFNTWYSSTCSLTSNDRGPWPPPAAPWIRQCYCPVLLFCYRASACLYM